MSLRLRILLFLFLFGLLPLMLAVVINLPLVLERVDLFYRHAFLQNLRADFNDLDQHRILTYGGAAQGPLHELNWLETAGMNGKKDMRKTVLSVNNIFALREAVRAGIGIAVLPDYLVGDDGDMVPILRDAELPEFDIYFVYPEVLRNSKRINVFRDFLVARARDWSF